MLQRITPKITAIVCIFVLACCYYSMPKPVTATQDTGIVNININNKPLVYIPGDQNPVIIADRTYVPLRIISENLGAQVDWKNDSRQVVIKWRSRSADSIPVNNTKDVQIIIDGQVLVIPADLGKAYISKLGRTMIPLRAVGEAMNCEVNWDNETGTVDINSSLPPVTVPEITPPAEELPNPLPNPQPDPQVIIVPPADTADARLLKDLALYRTNLKLMNGAVINSEELLLKDPSAFSSEQLSIFNTYLGQLSKYQPGITLPGGETVKTADMTIMGKSYLTAAQLEKWIQSEIPRLTAKMAAQGKSLNAIPDLAELYIRIGEEYGIRGDLAFCQAAKETGYWQFTGSVQPWQNNYCGLWATGTPLTGQESFNGADPTKLCFEAGTHGATFVSPEAGVEAHIQHLYAYACKNPLPAGKVLVDPRFALVNKGIAPTWQQLNARWAVPGTTYGQSIIYDYWLKAANS